MTMKHTPGPWEVDRPIRGYAYSVLRPGLEPPHEVTAIADIPEQRTDADEALANARLIAAAPELLAACNEMLAFIEDTKAAFPGQVPWGEPSYEDHEMKWRQIIAKAEGSEP